MSAPLSLAAQRQAIEHCLALLRGSGSTEPEIIDAAYAGVETLRWLEGRADLVRSIARLDREQPALAALLATFPDARIADVRTTP